MKRIAALLLACTMLFAVGALLTSAAEPTNVAAGKSYKTTPLFCQVKTDDGKYVWSDEGTPNYPDEGGVTLTDGKTDVSPDTTGELYYDKVFMGFSGITEGGSPEYKELGYAWLRIDLGKTYSLSELKLWVGSSKLGAGIGATNMTVQYFTVADMDGNDAKSLGDAIAAKDDKEATAVAVSQKLDTPVEAQYIEVRVVRNGWIFVTEFEAMGVESGNAGDEPESSEADSSAAESSATSSTTESAATSSTTESSAAASSTTESAATSSTTESAAASSTASSTASSAASSTASVAESSKPASGDAGLLCFAVIAVVSIAGVAIAVKVRK